jgi:DMSO/TMAO reductase YedYZ molybdopterin-dependent catalytic subunit
VKPAAGTRREYTPLEDHYRIDITTIPPVIDGAKWRLEIGGLVERPLVLTLDQIRAYEPLHQFVTLACISNPVGGTLIGTTRWTGVSLQRLLPELRLKPEATHLKLSSADRFYEIVPLETIENDARVMLAYEWDGVPLETKHGFPLRIYVPDLYGMKQPKWLTSIEATDRWEPGYWVRRGWDETARMKATSVIDTVSVDMMLAQADRDTLIPVGGIAHAGARGVSRVEVRTDGGPWREARLRTPLSETTWVVWRYDWPFQKGEHTLAVRCFDGRGDPQIVEASPPHPSGASGLHRKSAML